MTDGLAAGDGGDDGGDGDQDRDGAAAFVAARPKLFGVAYRMLGTSSRQRTSSATSPNGGPQLTGARSALPSRGS